MPRLKEVRRADVEKDSIIDLMYQFLFEDRCPVEAPGTETGTPGNWWTVFAIVPDAFKHTLDGFKFYRSKNRKIDPVLRELGQIRAGYTIGSQFVFSQHCKACRGVGMSEAQIENIPNWQTADCYSEVERAVLAYTDQLCLDKGRVADGTFKVLQKHLSDEEILEFTYITCTYSMHATMSRALRLEYDDVDERIIEIAAPEGANLDVMRGVDS